jgi:TolB-like protein
VLVQAQGLDTQLKPLVDEVVAGAEQAGVMRLTVADFADLQGRTTELGRFVAEELGTSLVLAKAKFGVIDRANLRTILAEHKLSMSGLVNPNTAKKLGEIAGVDGIVTGTITPLGDSVRITVKVIATDTAMVVAAARSDVARTSAVEELLGSRVTGAENTSSGTGVAGGEGGGNVRAAKTFEGRWVRMTVQSFTIDARGKLRMGLRIDSLIEEEFRLRCYPFNLVDEEGAVWKTPHGQGLEISSYMQGTLLAPTVPTMASVSWWKTAGDARFYHLSGHCQASLRGRGNEFPVTITDLEPSM